MFRTVLFAAAVIASNTEAKLLATADGIRISPADIDQVVGAAEFRIRNERYQAQRRAVDKLLNEQLLTKEAAARAVSVPDLLSVEIDSHLLQPEQANVQVALTRAEKVYPTVPRDELINRIRAAMLQPQRAELQAAFFRRLREKYHARVLLEPPRLIFEPPGWMQFAGGATAPVTMVMFSDFQCPSCKNFFGTLNSLRDHFNHNLRIAFVNFPLKNHKAARSAALAAICGFRQGAGWRIAEELFKSALTDASDEKAEHGAGKELSVAETTREIGCAPAGVLAELDARRPDSREAERQQHFEERSLLAHDTLEHIPPPLRAQTGRRARRQRSVTGESSSRQIGGVRHETAARCR